MESRYNHKDIEKRTYEMWEQGGYFQPQINPAKKPFTIILPPPNASGKMHTGNVLMIAIEDLLVRWHRMKGEPTLWISGTDHAGTETQITFERELKKMGESRFDYDRDSLYKAIWDFVQKNKSLVENQIRAMGASVDWTRYKFTLDPDVVKTVRETFKKMAGDGLVYRDDYIVNYCPVCGTTYADVEVENRERNDPLYYIRYGLSQKSKVQLKIQNYLTIATVRPETLFGDAAVAVNPKDKRYKGMVGGEVLLPLVDKHIPVIADSYVDIKFGTGVVKVTPAHDKDDYGAGLRHSLEAIPVIDFNGRLNDKCGVYAGLRVLEARKKILEELSEKGLIEKIDENYAHAVKICKAGHDIEPTVLPNWFIKVETLKKPAHEAVKKGVVKIYPKWREITYHRWMENMHDWAVSRQNVWGIRIPAWYNIGENPNLLINFLDKNKSRVSGKISELLEKYSLEEIIKGLQFLRAPKESLYVIGLECPGSRFLQETDTFDTWFSSGQWPLVTLGYPHSTDFGYFYPTSVMETGWEILSKWVSRMMMFGYYLTGKPPFYNVYLHGLVRALDGRKMSKSFGNVINPEEYQEEYGTDALRMGLISGTANGKDFNFPRDKVIAYRNFANKLWNIGRFILMNISPTSPRLGGAMLGVKEIGEIRGMTKEDKEILKKLNATIKKIDANLEKFKFAQAGEIIYHFVWHDFADRYVESSKERIKAGDKAVLSVLLQTYLTSLKLLHPFMPFVTEEIWGLMPKDDNRPLIVSDWPISKLNGL